MTSRLLIVIVAVSVLGAGGCCKNDSDGTPTTTTATEKRFEGTYSSNWGSTTFTESGNTVSATYPRGTMTCKAAGDVLNCDWVEGSLRGKALLTRQPNGNINGTWGNGTSAINGGNWTFTKS